MADTPGAKKPRKRRARSAEKPPKAQFSITPEDDSDLMALVGPLKNRTTVSLMLFLYGLNHSDAAFAEYARKHREAREKRLSEG
jgi:hypothetical protein